VYGAFVRLTRSGLSIVEWKPITGALPPRTQGEWEAELSKYKTTPEYQQINRNISLDAYKQIFLVEWFHRLLARAAGLLYAIPLVFFLITGRLRWRESGRYIIIGLLFLSQAFMGWVMVASGLQDRPSVSHYLLAVHLFLALSLIGLAAWIALDRTYPPIRANAAAPWSNASRVALIAFIALIVQMAYGAFTAGLKAGHVSNTWPLMLGRLLPQGLFSQMQPPLLNLVAAPLTVAFIHRWLGVFSLIIVRLCLSVILRASPSHEAQVGLAGLGLLGALQVVLGVAVVISGVSLPLALLHQLNALLLFIGAVVVLHRLRAANRSAGRPLA
jgi:cytochrome c oxidase assembly protein subunit 15